MTLEELLNLQPGETKTYLISDLPRSPREVQNYIRYMFKDDFTVSRSKKQGTFTITKTI